MFCYSTAGLFPHLSLPLFRSPYSLIYHNIEIRPTDNPAMALKCLGERVSHMSPTLNQKLEMIKLREEGMLKAEIGHGKKKCFLR